MFLISSHTPALVGRQVCLPLHSPADGAQPHRGQRALRLGTVAPATITMPRRAGVLRATSIGSRTTDLRAPPPSSPPSPSSTTCTGIRWVRSASSLQKRQPRGAVQETRATAGAMLSPMYSRPPFDSTMPGVPVSPATPPSITSQSAVELRRHPRPCRHLQRHRRLRVSLLRPRRHHPRRH